MGNPCTSGCHFVLNTLSCTDYMYLQIHCMYHETYTTVNILVFSSGSAHLSGEAGHICSQSDSASYSPKTVATWVNETFSAPDLHRSGAANHDSGKVLLQRSSSEVSGG